MRPRARGVGALGGRAGEWLARADARRRTLASRGVGDDAVARASVGVDGERVLVRGIARARVFVGVDGWVG